MATLARRTPKKTPVRSRPKPPPRERLETQERREQLLAVAKSLFLERPYDQVSMDDLASRAGVSKGLVFHYFGSKRELYIELVRRGSDALLEATRPPEDRQVVEKLEAGLYSYLAYVQENAEAWTGLFTSGVGVDPEIASIVDRTRSTLADRIVSNMPGGASPHATLAARGFIGFVEATTLVWLPKRREKPEQLVELFVRVLAVALSVNQQGQSL